MKAQRKIDVTKALKGLRADRSPVGVTVHAADGRSFFLSKGVARRTAVRRNPLHARYLMATRRGSGKRRHPGMKPGGFCAKVWEYLETHNPNSDRWRATVLLYFDVCEAGGRERAE
ncbi:MAG TPA: hypothetical protein VGX97_05200 [bacterium]|nr:hypothetical protein [bacterium]